MSTGRSSGPKSRAAISPPRLGKEMRRTRGSSRAGMLVRWFFIGSGRDHGHRHALEAANGVVEVEDRFARRLQLRHTLGQCRKKDLCLRAGDHLADAGVDAKAEADRRRLAFYVIALGSVELPRIVVGPNDRQHQLVALSH